MRELIDTRDIEGAAAKMKARDRFLTGQRRHASNSDRLGGLCEDGRTQ